MPTPDRALTPLLSPLAAAWLLACAAPGQNVTGHHDDVRAAVARAATVLQASMAQWSERRSCVSCHHQALGTMAVVMCAERRIEVDEAIHAGQLAHLGRTLGGDLLLGEGGINGAFGRGFQLTALAAAGTRRSDKTSAAAAFLAGKAVVAPGAAGREHAATFWPSFSWRPPHEAYPTTGSAFAIRALRAYHADGRSAEAARLVAGARRWLEQCAPAEHEGRVMRVLGLFWAGAEPAAIASAARDVLRRQNGDGGWSQLSHRPSDAYATGQALAVLQQSGAVDVDDDAFRRGVDFLLHDQRDDGTWLVETRRQLPGLTHFETGFPHGEHQFVSTAATAWAIMALCAALDPAPSRSFSGPRPDEAASPDDLGLTALQRAAAFGADDALRSLLADAGRDVDEPGPLGLTALHASVWAPERMTLLLARGAAVDARSDLGVRPLHVAAWYGTNGDAAERLLAAGAAPLAADTHGNTPVSRAAEARKRDLLRQLLERSDDDPARAKALDEAMRAAASADDVETAALLLEAGAGVDARFEDETLLHVAAHDDRPELAQLLLRAGHPVDAKADAGRTPLAYAAMVPHESDALVRVLLDAGADPRVRDAEGHGPLDLARRSKNAPAIRALEAALGKVR